ncbi:MAG: putative lipid II flippase FtsW [Casimicrobiaceae bacterium]
MWVTLVLLTIGIVMVYSASIATAEAARFTGYRGTYFLARHALFALMGVAAAAVVVQVPMRIWQRISLWLFIGAVILLILVLIPGIGRDVNGSRRWIALFVFNLQPSELMKLFAVLYAADYAVRKSADMQSVKRGFLPMFAVMLVVGYLLLREPDFGAFLVTCCIAFGVLFLGGLNASLFAALGVLLPAAFAVLIVTSPYRMQRIVAFLDPWSDPFGKGYQLSHSLIAFGRGEWFGAGLGASVEKLFYLPEAHTDFLLAVIAEETGFAGVLIVVALFAWLVWRAFMIGRQAGRLGRPYAALVAQGTGVWLGVQTLINMGVNMGVLPTKGLTLPLLSYGGSAIIANCLAIGLLLRVDFESRQLLRGYVV